MSNMFGKFKQIIGVSEYDEEDFEDLEEMEEENTIDKTDNYDETIVSNLQKVVPFHTILRIFDLSKGVYRP